MAGHLHGCFGNTVAPEKWALGLAPFPVKERRFEIAHEIKAVFPKTALTAGSKSGGGSAALHNASEKEGAKNHGHVLECGGSAVPLFDAAG